MRLLKRHCLLGVAAAALLSLASPAHAQNTGFQLNRYEPTAAGEWSFMVDHPWYSSTRYFAGGITLNYGHQPLVFGTAQPDGTFQQNQVVIGHQLLGHVDLAGSFLDRVTLSLTLPITLLERGTDTPIAGITPMQGAGVGDPRIGGMVRLWKHADRDPISVHLGAFVWIPLRAIAGDSSVLTNTTGEQGVRVMPKIVLGGLKDWLRWSFTAAFYYRPEATIGNLENPAGSKTGSELQFGLGLYYANLEKRFAVGPEALLATQVIGPEGVARDHTSLEILLGAHYNIAKLVQVGLAGGIGALRQPGTPDGRVLLRLAYAPIREPDKDTDGDGIMDKDDACVTVKGIKTGDRRTNGCPPADRDGDGVMDHEDLCPDEPMGQNPDPERRGCPLSDRDKDGVFDKDDLCPDVHMGNQPDPARRGCPMGDRDGDGVLDNEDMCPDVHMGQTPDPARRGCPAGDKDKDGVLDPEDKCPEVPAGLNPDPDRIGCPLPDRDHDNVPDKTDACPDKPGAPDPDPKKNGCPGGLIQMTDGELKILKPVFFATDQDVILPQSFPVLKAVATVLKHTPMIKKMSVDGHTDDRGGLEHNQDLSERRAKSVVRFLIKEGVDQSRLEPHGHGQTHPIKPNTTQQGRAANRRVEFNVTDPPVAKGVQQVNPADVASPDTTDTAPKNLPNKPAPGGVKKPAAQQQKK
ncbi:MAG: OmpA family protein [Polyangia bacterium]